MAVTQNTYTGNGSTVLYSFTFPYLETTDVKVTVNGVITTAYTFANATTIQFNTAPLANTAIRIYRDTDDASLAATFFSGSAIRAQDLNDDFTQNLYSTQEVKARYLDRQSGEMESGYAPNTSTSVITKGYMETNYGIIDEVGFTRWRQTATAGQTTFSGTGNYGGVLTYVPTREQVYINGALQQRSADYTADNGTSVVFAVGLTVGDVVDIVCINNVVAGTANNAANITYSGQFSNQTARTVAAKLADVVSVKDFGAVDDGDVAGNGTDNTTAFQNAINTGKTVYVPKGIYKITGTIELLNGTKALRGDSNFPILVKTTPGPAIRIGATGSALNEQSRIENLYIMSPTAPSFSATPNATQAAVVVSGDGASNPAAVQHPQVLNIRIGNFGVGIYLADVVNARVEKCFIQMLQDYSGLPGFTAANRFVGVLLDATPFSAGGISPMASTQLLDNDVSGAGIPSAVTSFGYWLVGSDIRDTFFDNCEAASVTYGYYVDSGTADFNWNVHIRNAIVDAFKGNGIYILNTSGPGCITIDGGYFVGVTGASAAIYANNAAGVTVTGGAQILGYTTNTAGDDGVRLDNCKSCNIVGNSFQNCNYAISLNQSSYCTIAANHVFASTTATEPSPQLLTAIRVFSSAIRNTIVGNTVRGLNGTHQYDEGLLVQSGCTDNVIAHNIFDSTSVVTPYNILEATTSVTRSNAGTLTTKAGSIVVDGTNDLSLVSQLGPVRFSPVNAERARITTQGYLKASSDGTYSGVAGTFHELRSNAGSGSLVAQVSNTSATGNGVQIDINSNSTAYAYLIGYSTSSAANRIIVWSNGNVVNTNNSYGAISDIKLKENIVDANSQWDDLKALQVRNYNFMEGQTHTQIGLVAQEVELVSPGLVTESPDRDAEGNDLGTVTKSVNYSVLYMKAVKALQEAMERIETIESKVTSLEANS